MEEDLPALDLVALRALLERALEEDRAREDLTGHALLEEEARVRATVVAKGHGVLAGLALAEEAFRLLDPSATVTAHYGDGEVVAPGVDVLTVEGRARAVLGAERTVLNLLGHLGGVATLTHAFVEATMGTGIEVLDTRKTLPGLRALEKYAVRCGGGTSHRLDLADAAMVKENHLLAAYGRTGAASIRAAALRLRGVLPPDRTLYVEAEDIEEVRAAAEGGADVVLLDGFDLGAVREAVRLVRSLPPPRPLLEATGGVRLEDVEALAAAGVQRVSVGALTHSAPSLDLSLRVRSHQAPPATSFPDAPRA